MVRLIWWWWCCVATVTLLAFNVTVLGEVTLPVTVPPTEADTDSRKHVETASYLVGTLVVLQILILLVPLYVEMVTCHFVPKKIDETD